MNRVINFLISMMLFLLLGCSHTMPGGLEDATAPVPQKGYQILGESEGSVSSTFVFGIQTSQPDMEVAIRQAIAKRGGDELINVTWYHKSVFYFLFSKYTFSVKGMVIKRTQEGGPITTIKPRPFAESPPAGPAFDGLSFGLSYSRGTDNEFGISGYSGLRLRFSLKDKDALTYFYPEISYANLSKEFDELGFGGFDNSIRTIPITFNVGINGSQVRELAQTISPNFNPYANFGLGYYLTEFDEADWEWTEFGYNFGLGVEYRVQPNLSVGGGFSRHSVFTGETYTYWDWSVGLSYFLDQGFRPGPARTSK